MDKDARYGLLDESEQGYLDHLRRKRMRSMQWRARETIPPRICRFLHLMSL